MSVVPAELQRDAPRMDLISSHWERLVLAGVFDDWDDLKEGHDAILYGGGIYEDPLFKRFVQEFYPDDLDIFAWEPESDGESDSSGARAGVDDVTRDILEKADEGFWSFLEACQNVPPPDDDEF